MGSNSFKKQQNIIGFHLWIQNWNYLICFRTPTEAMIFSGCWAFIVSLDPFKQLSVHWKCKLWWLSTCRNFSFILKLSGLTRKSDQLKARRTQVLDFASLLGSLVTTETSLLWLDFLMRKIVNKAAFVDLPETWEMCLSSYRMLYMKVKYQQFFFQNQSQHIDIICSCTVRTGPWIKVSQFLYMGL